LLHKIFKNKANLKNLEGQELLDNIFLDKDSNKHVLSKEVRGNDLVVDYIFYNNFAQANLENANFKDAVLWLNAFDSANLTNANLTGADLSNANLDGANLEGAVLDNATLTGATLKCINHPICLTDNSNLVFLKIQQFPFRDFSRQCLGKEIVESLKKLD
jgi:uncharacterized protein YjbI with pentapeptide repeats